MLILTRRPGESIRIGNQIVITPLGVQGLQVRVGIQAPASVEVHREEVFQRIQAERDGAAPAKPQHIDVHIRQAADQVDPRNLFIVANPAGFSPEDLEFGGTGFADKYANDAYAVFLSGYRAALEASPCEC